MDDNHLQTTTFCTGPEEANPAAMGDVARTFGPLLDHEERPRDVTAVPHIQRPTMAELEAITREWDELPELDTPWDVASRESRSSSRIRGREG